jgi:hypothetical protein
MNRPGDDRPERLMAADATDFERRLLQAARDRRPSPAASARMAKAIGVTAAAVGTTLTAKTIAAEAAVSKAGAAAGASAVWPWISVSVLGLVVAGAVVGSRARHSSPRETAPALAPVTALPTPTAASAPAEPSTETAEPAPSVASPIRRSRPAAGPELSEQIAVIDAARAALSAGADRRALETVRRYQERYPNGSFRPEATALKIEALLKLGRQAEARTLAERFVTEQRGSLLAERVAALAGLPRP